MGDGPRPARGARPRRAERAIGARFEFIGGAYDGLVLSALPAGAETVYFPLPPPEDPKPNHAAVPPCVYHVHAPPATGLTVDLAHRLRSQLGAPRAALYTRDRYHCQRMQWRDDLDLRGPT